MKLHTDRRDAVTVLGTTATGALSVSLGIHPGLALEVTGLLLVLLLVRVLLRTVPPPRRRRPDTRRRTALDEARASVESAMAGPYGVQGAFRRQVRAAAIARLERDGRTIDEVRATLPPAVAALLDADWQEDRGLTATEVDLVLRTMEELT